MMAAHRVHMGESLVAVKESQWHLLTFRFSAMEAAPRLRPWKIKAFKTDRLQKDPVK